MRDPHDDHDPQSRRSAQPEVDLDPQRAGERAQAQAWSVEIRSALRRLEPRESRVLHLIYFDRRTQRQVAEELHMARASVARSAATGLQALALLVGAPAN